MMPAVSSVCNRSVKIFVAMPSPDCWKSLNVRNPRTMRSRMINNDQRSPNRSREMLTGQPDLRFELCFANDPERLSKVTCEMQVILDGEKSLLPLWLCLQLLK